uniref:Ig-like domain-containing domain n=1 Tax=Roseihalotalea indica TaxID=2867963 RepID=A0AA49GTU5_9BACT|nr:Ig-like domain-containing domain [Tunicatimonas sp. TK19036]
MKQSYWLLIVWILLIAIGSCARRGTPTGGPKDSIPPELVRMTPELETVNFKGKEIELEFNEYIEARDLKKELIITPPVEDYDFYVSRRMLHLEIEGDLRDSTTYTLNFRDAVKDISERNPAKNVVVAFSTGSKIDSFQVSGTVHNLLTQEPIEDAIVSLYDVNDTLDVFTGPPMYLAKTDEEGNYTIRYIRAGLYSIYAYVDENTNLKVDSNNEPFGFKSKPVYLGTDINQQIKADSLGQVDSTNTLNRVIDLVIQRQDIRPIVLQSARANGKYFEVKFNKSLDYYDLSPSGNISSATQQFLEDSVAFNLSDSTPTLFSNFQDQQKVVRIYNTLKQDSLQIKFSAIDSAQQILSDTTLYVKFAESRRQPAEFTSQFQTKNSEFTDTISGTFTFSKPVARITTDSILLSYDTLFYVPINYAENFTWNKQYDHLTMKVPIRRQQIIDSTLVYLQLSDSLENESKIRLQEQYLDSLQSTATIEKRLEWLQQFGQQNGTSSYVRNLTDSLQTLESESAKNDLLNSYIDTVQINREFPLKNYSREEIANSLASFNFYAAPGSFMSVENDSSEQAIQKFSFKRVEDYGVIRGTVASSYPSYTIQLLDQDFNMVREKKNVKDFSFEMVPPGKYQIRVLIDADNDGVWEKGSILKKEEPEPIFFFGDLIDLRANWERSDLTITIGELSTLSSE